MGSFASVGNVRCQVWLDVFCVILISCYICLLFLPFSSRRMHYVTSRPKNATKRVMCFLLRGLHSLKSGRRTGNQQKKAVAG